MLLFTGERLECRTRTNSTVRFIRLEVATQHHPVKGPWRGVLGSSMIGSPLSRTCFHLDFVLERFVSVFKRATHNMHVVADYRLHERNMIETSRVLTEAPARSRTPFAPHPRQERLFEASASVAPREQRAPCPSSPFCPDRQASTHGCNHGYGG